MGCALGRLVNQYTLGSLGFYRVDRLTCEDIIVGVLHVISATAYSCKYVFKKHTQMSGVVLNDRQFYTIWHAHIKLYLTVLTRLNISCVSLVVDDAHKWTTQTFLELLPRL